MKRIAQLSVAVATLDRPEALCRCLDGLLNGEVLPAEVIVVDQGRGDVAISTSGPPVIARYAQGPLKVVYVRQERRGLSAARNRAIAAARYPIVAITDDDCLPRADWIATLERDFSGPDAPDVVTGRVLPLGPARPGLYVVSARESTRRTWFRGKVTPWLVGTGGNCAVRSAWLQKVGGYDEQLGVGSPGRAGEDADLFYRLLRAGARIQYDPDCVIYHERQSKERRQASRWSYGYGVGALCGTWLRRGDLFAMRMLGQWLVTQAWALAGSLRKREWWLAYTRLLSLGGIPPGLLYGLAGRRRS